MYEKILKESEALEKQLRNWRRDFHRFPETGWLEMRTSSLIARHLAEMGYDTILTGTDVCLPSSRMGLPTEEVQSAHYNWALNHGADPEFLPQTKNGATGVIAVLSCGNGPTAALRFDIDALPVLESSAREHFPCSQGFSSEVPGVMHACGHDGHIAIGLGCASLLMKLRDSLHGTVKLIFQPAEEGVRGARSIAEHGHLAGTDFLLGSHLAGNASIQESSIGIGTNSTLATSKLDITFYGTATHAASTPELGSYAMLSAATAILNLHAIPRHGEAATRINVGKINGGTARNIVCDQVTLELEVRGTTSSANDYLTDYAKRIARQAATMHGCTCQIREQGSAPSGSNSPKLCRQVQSVCENHLQLPVSDFDSMTSKSEDFSYLSDYVISHGGLSCYFNNVTPCAGSFHNGLFDFNEKALVNGVKVFVGTAFSLLG